MKDSFSLCVVVPAYNEEEGLEEFHARLVRVLDGITDRSQVLYVDDGSRDATQDVVRRIAARDPRAALLALSRNFGKEAALSAGLDHADADAVVVIDADLQDAPEVIPQLVEAWKAGADTAYATRTHRDGESVVKRATASAFYSVVGNMSRTPIPRDTGDFRLINRRSVLAIRKLREQHRFMKGLFSWIGFKQVSVKYSRDRRFAGETKWNYWKLWNFAITGITSFSSSPLKLSTYIGVFIAALSFLYASWIIFKTLWFGDVVRGYPTIMVTVLFLGGIQLVAIGLLGEYIGRMFDESKQRPLYLVDEQASFGLDVLERPAPGTPVRTG
jgi:polyisoprenyl-phosphate glycosyltransferase